MMLRLAPVSQASMVFRKEAPVYALYNHVKIEPFADRLGWCDVRSQSSQWSTFVSPLPFNCDVQL